MNSFSLQYCPICKKNIFLQHDVLSKDLINDWNISLKEVEYINLQQGLTCSNCNVNLRGMTLIHAVLTHFNYNNITELYSKCTKKVLEINEVVGLSKFLSKLNNHILMAYPEIDMQNMNIESETFDIIIHSDTLEHIPNSIKGLEECYRILKNDGVMFFTIPIIHNRLTIKREGMSDSYHGDYLLKQKDYIVHTEYGSNFYMELLAAGFKEIRLYSLVDESSLSIAAIKK